MSERTVEDIRKEWEKENNKPSKINLLVIKDDDRKIYISSFENDYVEHLELDNLAKDKRILELEADNAKLSDEIIDKLSDKLIKNVANLESGFTEEAYEGFINGANFARDLITKWLRENARPAKYKDGKLEAME